MSEKLESLLKKIDEINSQDPNTVRVEDFEYPKELIYSKQLTEWVKKLNPKASPELLIAARGQHVARWTSPRSDYPMDRGGYLRWREDLKKKHAKIVTDLMKEEGWSDEEIKKVETIILKRDMKSNRDSQTIEDALCLVFFETQFEELKEKTPADKMEVILKKTWKKMSPQGQKVALELDFSEENKNFIKNALQ